MHGSRWAWISVYATLIVGLIIFTWGIGVMGFAQPNDECQTTGTPLTVDTNLPDDIATGNQAEVNCFAWKTFIALNWPADPIYRGRPIPTADPNDFGTPGDLRPTVWQTYRLPSDVFRPGAAQPLAWQDDDSIPGACQAAANLIADRRFTVVSMVSEFDNPIDRPGRRALVSADVLPGSIPVPPDILIDQAGNLVHYEERMNEVEYNYILANQLYNGDQQATWAATQGILVPPRDPFGSDGSAIEIKAAWREVENEPEGIRSRYFTTTGLIYDALTDSCSGPVLMGLVGLHIMRKTATMQQFMWSTFEQVDNVADGVSSHPTSIPYSFYNPACSPPLPCTPNATPQPTVVATGTPTLLPVQVERVQPIAAEVRALNERAQMVIQQSNEESVWQFYQLINVTWPSHSQLGDPGPGTPVPLTLTPFGFTSADGRPVNNVVMETYHQDMDCTMCHGSAAIAPSAAAGCGPNLAADFSFVFRHADTPAQFEETDCIGVGVTRSRPLMGRHGNSTSSAAGTGRSGPVPVGRH